MWCAVYSHGITGAYFFENEEERTVNVDAERYNVLLETFVRIDLTSLTARFAVVPTRLSNCSHSRIFHASPQDNVSGQTHFLFRGHHLARPLA
jgi:hypothetical protein